jgi:ACS family hexuronate transporter-like MFS transporter
MMLLSLLSYVDRNVLAILSPTILKETGLTAADYSFVISAFSLAYLVGNPAWGLILDRYGVRVGVGLAAAIWTCASASHAWATGLVTFALARAVLGFGEGATFPGGMRTATQTLDPERRARGVALAYSGGSLGAVLTPVLVTPVAAAWGWRGAFLATGILGVSWLAMWAEVSRRPELGPGQESHAAPSPRIWDRPILAFAAAYAFGGLPLGFVLYGAPLYLARGLGYDQTTLGHVLWVPPLGWELGYFFWGWVLDRAARGKARPDSFGPLFAALAVLTLPFAATPFVRPLPAVLGLMFLQMFVSAGFVMVSLSEVTHTSGRSHSAFLSGIGAGAWSGLMAIVMPVFGKLFDRSEYGAAYAIATLCPILAWAIRRVLLHRRVSP